MLTPTISVIIIIVIITISWVDYIKIVIAVDVERLPPINVSNWEHREYRGIKLANGLQAVLIHDSEAQKSAAAMVVAVGSLNDAKEQPGIANLVRYLLLVACRRYCKKHEFKAYLKERGGKLGSELMTTEAEHKHHFSFEVNNGFLEPTLKRFAQHFTEPLFEGVDDAALKEALGNLSRKHDRLMSADTMRTAQLLKSISEQDHPYNNLSYGTLDMLNEYAGLGREPLDDKLMNFVKKWYSANLMRLVVIANEKLDVLERMVANSFADLTNTGAEKLMFSYEQHPWKLDQLKHKICIVPAKHSVREIRLTFPTPDVLGQYKVSPEKYVIQFIKHRAVGTLGYVLPRKGLCKAKSIRAEYQTYAGIGFFTIVMEPTEEGVKKVNNILDLTFQYIHLLKNEGVNKWFYDEEKHLDKLNFKIWNKNELEIVQSLASALLDYPIEDSISFEYIRGPWNAESLHKFLSYLRPDNVNISIIDKSCVECAANIRTEPWYKTKYHIERIPDEMIKKWESLVSYFPELKMPSPNEFIPENLQTDMTDPDQPIPDYPYVILKSSISRIWYKRDDTMPIVQMALDINSPIMHTNLVNGILTEIFVKSLHIALKEYEYNVSRTGNMWVVMVTRYGFQFRIGCVHSKFTVLLEKILSKLLDFETAFTEEDFEMAKKEVFDDLRSLQRHSKTYRDIATYYMSYLLNSGGWTVDSIIPLENALKFQNLRKFLIKLLSRIHIQGLIYGNVVEQKGKDIANIVEGYFKRTSQGMLPQEMLNLQERSIQLEGGKNFVGHAFSRSSKHLYQAFFPFSSKGTSTADDRLYVKSGLLLKIIKEACTKILPPRDTGTSECRVESIKGVRGFVFVITSQMHPLQLDMRVEKFLEVITVRNTTLYEFASNKVEMVMHTIRLGEREDRIQRFYFYWDEITSRTYYFQRRISLVSEYEAIEKEDLIAFYKEFLAKRSPTRRKLAVYVYSDMLIQSAPRNISAEDKHSEELRNTKIEDSVEFKISSTALPTRMPLMDS